MDDSDLLAPPARLDARPKRALRPPGGPEGDDGADLVIAAGDAFATVKGQRQAEGLRFRRARRRSFTLAYDYLPIPWWEDDTPGLLLLEYPGLFTLRLRGKDAIALEPLISDRRVTWIRECDEAEAAALPLAVFRIDIIRVYPSREMDDGQDGG